MAKSDWAGGRAQNEGTAQKVAGGRKRAEYKTAEVLHR